MTNLRHRGTRLFSIGGLLLACSCAKDGAGSAQGTANTGDAAHGMNAPQGTPTATMGPGACASCPMGPGHMMGNGSMGPGHMMGPGLGTMRRCRCLMAVTCVELETKEEEDRQVMKPDTLDVSGMTCGGCS